MHAFAYLGLAIETPEVSTNEEYLIKSSWFNCKLSLQVIIYFKKLL